MHYNFTNLNSILYAFANKFEILQQIRAKTRKSPAESAEKYPKYGLEKDSLPERTMWGTISLVWDSHQRETEGGRITHYIYTKFR